MIQSMQKYPNIFTTKKEPIHEEENLQFISNKSNIVSLCKRKRERTK